MRDAVNLITLCRGLDPYTPAEAEEVVRARIRRTGEHPLHVYGFLIHLALYPFTILLAIGGYFCIALSASARVGAKRTGRQTSGGKLPAPAAAAAQRKSSFRTVVGYLRRALLTLCTVI